MLVFRLSVRCYSIRARIQADLISALKAKDSNKSTLLRQVQSELVNFEKARPAEGQIAESDYYQVIWRCSEKWKKAIQDYEEMKAKDEKRAIDIQKIIGKEREELQLIQSYLAEPYKEDELKQIVTETMSKLGITAPNAPKLGAVMKEALNSIDKTRLPSSKDLSNLVRSCLSA